MGKALFDSHAAARQVFEAADDALGYSLSRLCFEGPEEQLKLTEFTQPALLTVSIAACAVLTEAGFAPESAIPLEPNKGWLLIADEIPRG